MPEVQNNYSQRWRKKKSHRWLLIQMIWYYKFRDRILAGWRKPKSSEADEYDTWALRND